MPAINVAKTDTFEVQRQKINEIGAALFGITQGGSDLNTEILKIGDGTVSDPSLSFASSPQVGFYKPSSNVLGIASAEKRIANFSVNGLTLTQNIKVEKNSISSEGIAVLNFGSNYDAGSFTNVLLTGGSGTAAEASITVTEYVTTTTDTAGANYTDGNYFGINLNGGSGSGAVISFDVNSGIIENIVFENKGSGYQQGDILTLPETVSNVSTNVDSTSQEVSLPANIISQLSVGYIVNKVSGTGDIDANTTIFTIDVNNNTILLSATPTTTGSIVLNFVPPYGDPAGNLQFEITDIGVVESVQITEAGYGYDVNDRLSVDPNSLALPITYSVINRTIQKIIFANSVPSSAFSVGDSVATVFAGEQGTPGEIYYLETTGGNIDFLIIENIGVADGGDLALLGDATTYTVQTASSPVDRFFIDVGNGPEYNPSITLFLNNTYIFDFSDSSNASHTFSLSKYRDGIWSPSYLQDVSTVLSTSSTQITVADTSQILPGMLVTVSSGTGELFPNTQVISVLDSTTVVLNSGAKTSGSALVNFRGKEYTENVSRTDTDLTIRITDTTPTLYYYCQAHPDTGGFDNEEVQLVVNLNNPKQFGSGLDILVAILTTQNIIQSDISSGSLTSVNINSTSANTSTLDVTSLLTANSIEASSVKTGDINFDTTINITSIDTNFNSNVSIGSTIDIVQDSGNLTTSGILKSTSSLNINDKILISENQISTLGQNDLEISPASGRLAKVIGSTALIIPSGSTLERPGIGVAENGAIRFNTQTSQYEGYNSSTTSWSSLGGVRDLDNNTYIVAENTVGANDNTLWFYNDDNNTFRFSTEYQTFYSTKKVRSLNTSAPSYINWSTNLPVTAGQYLKYRNDIYLVINGGTTGTSGNEPDDTSGNTFANGSATLQYNTTAVAPLTFEEISEVRIAPLGGTSLVINGDLKLFDNEVTTITNDILLTPPENKKVKVNTTTSLVIPVGTDSQKGSPEVGSIRYNTTINQFEGFNSSLNWTSLGGVRDVDGNTYIIPETGPGTNENILYFYNNDTNTLRVTENQLEFDVIDTVASPTSDVLNINVSLITLDSLATSIDNTDQTSTFISSTKENFDLGISTGLFNDTVLRIVDTGDLYYNTGFGTGTYDGIKLLDKDLKTFELKNFKIVTESNTLVKGTSDSGNTIIYNPALSVSAKVQIVAYNLTTGDKEFFEYSVVDEVNDVFYTEYGNIKTGAELISAQFSIVPTGVRLTYTLDSSISAGNNILVKIISQVIKR